MAPRVKISRVFDLIETREYYSRLLGVLPNEDQSGNVKVKCPFHTDTSASLSINVRNPGGVYNCFGCGEHGNFINFHQKFKDIEDPNAAALDILEMFGVEEDALAIKYIQESEVLVPHNNLLNPNRKAAKKALHWLQTKRGLSLDIIHEFQLGFETDTGRVTIPIRDTEGHILSIRRWLPEYERHTKLDEDAKMIGIRGFNAHTLYPLQALQGQEIILTEGELDTLLLRSLGFNAMTHTGGVRVKNPFAHSWYRLFRGKDVIICYDNDEAGREGAMDRREGLYQYVASVKEVFMSKTVDGKDVTDYWQDNPETFAEQLRLLIDTAPPWILQAGETHYVNLYQAVDSKLFGKRLAVRGIVTHRGDQPMAIPRKVRCVCDKPQKGCPGCPAITGDGVKIELIDPSHPKFIELITSTQKQQIDVLKEILNIGCKSPDIEILEYQNVEEVCLIPEVDMSDTQVTYTMRPAYSVGFGVEYNDTYEWHGTSTIDPRTNLVTFIFDRKERLNKLDEQVSSLDRVIIDGVEDTVYNHLKAFQVGTNNSVKSKLEEIYRDLEANVTLMVKRTDVLRAIDLLMHSPIAFTFNGEPVTKGWMDVLIIGDTATGKSKTLERYRAHVQAGEIYSGENISKVGIIGGYINMSGNSRPRFMLGVWPLNDGRACFIDEGSGLSEEALSDLTMLRDHGIAESTKQGQRNRYPAHVRFGMLSNPPGRKDGGENSMTSYAFGVLAVRDLIKHDADISRFDMVVAVATDEVSSDLINRSFTETAVPHVYSSELCNLGIRWAWSRKAGHIRFTNEATNLCLKLADEMGKSFDPAIPLVLAQSQRVKLARIAAAIAIRLFNTPDGESVIVDAEHVLQARHYLMEDFCKDSMGYHTYSAAKRRENSLPNREAVKRLLDNNSFMLYECLLSNRVFQKRTLEDYTGEHRAVVDEMFRELLRYRCIAQSRQYYRLTPAFIKFLSTYEHPHKGDYYKDTEGDTAVGGLD